MRGEVLDTEKVSKQIALDLQWRFLGTRAELFLDRCGAIKAEGRKGRLRELLPIFCQYCGKMPGAWVRYEKDHPDGNICTVVGHCGKRCEECEWICRNYRERPRACIVFTHREGRRPSKRRIH